MKAVFYTTHGDASVLQFTNLPIPSPHSQQLLVRVHATALNRADILQRLGKYPPPPHESTILGLEIAGDVISVGNDVTNINIGDRVCGLVGSGGYAEYCLLDSGCAIPIPSNMSYLEAAAIPEAFLTAYEALFSLGQLKPDETVLIHAGASGVGSAAIQLAKHAGATVLTTVSSADKAAKINSLNADEIINYRTTDFADVIRQHHGDVDVIIDFIGASYFNKHLTLLKNKGRLICVGLLGGHKTEMNLNMIISKQLSIKGLIMRSRSIKDKRHLTQHFIKQILPLFINKTLHPVIDSIYDWDAIQAAHHHMESNQHAGKVLIKISS